jgi:hypothetical protein
LGLEPVISSSKKKRRKQNQVRTGDRQDPLEQSKSDIEELAPDISLKTQLDYARKGHAVLRSFLPTHIIQSLRSELVHYAASHQLEAWRLVSSTRTICILLGTLKSL